jgi:hypothetical protein
MDPITAIGLASTALTTIKKAIKTGKDIQEVTGEIGKFFSHTAAANTKKKPSKVRKLLDKGSVEQEALETVVNQKKLEQMESELRELIVVTYGVETYKEMITLRRKIKIDRELEEEKALLKKKEALQNSVYMTAIVVCVSFIVWIVSSILERL